MTNLADHMEITHDGQTISQLLVEKHRSQFKLIKQYSVQAVF